MSANPEEFTGLTNPEFPRRSHQITAVYGENKKLTHYLVTTPTGSEFEVPPNHHLVLRLAEAALKGAEDLDQRMLPVYAGAKVIEYLKARGFSEEDIPATVEDALTFLNDRLRDYNEAEALITEGKTYNGTQALIDQYINSLSMPWWDYVKLSPTLRAQLNILGQALTAKALQHAGVDKDTLETSKIALEITKNNATIAKLAAGIIKTIEQLANSTINVGAKAINTTASLVPMIGRDIGEGVGRTIGGTIGGAMNQFDRSKNGDKDDAIDTPYRPISPIRPTTSHAGINLNHGPDDEGDDFLG